jgi:hypothetical protein
MSGCGAAFRNVEEERHRCGARWKLVDCGTKTSSRMDSAMAIIAAITVERSLSERIQNELDSVQIQMRETNS